MENKKERTKCLNCEKEHFWNCQDSMNKTDFLRKLEYVLCNDCYNKFWNRNQDGLVSKNENTKERVVSTSPFILERTRLLNELSKVCN